MQLPSQGASCSCGCCVEELAWQSHESVESSLQCFLGRGVTPVNQVSLDALKFSYRVHVEIRQGTVMFDDFQRVLLIQQSLQQAAA